MKKVQDEKVLKQPKQEVLQQDKQGVQQTEQRVLQQPGKRVVPQSGQRISNRKVPDSSSKLIFGNARLFAQFLRDYIDIPLLRNVREEDIEDVSERYVPLFTSEREADTVKRVKLSAAGLFG